MKYKSFDQYHAIPLSLYIHIPFCVRKCPYCDFYSCAMENIPEEQYLHALMNDLKQDSALGRKIVSIFIGGGTPSLLSVKFFDRLLNEISKHQLKSDLEITLEANPGTFDSEKMKAIRKIGFNRLSIGVQSFQDQTLKRLDRIHDAKMAKYAVDIARAAGFDNINLDLMHGLPDQTLDDAMNDLQIALSLHPEHISWYQLTPEPETPFAKQNLTLPDEETIWQMQQTGKNILTRYQHYEISNFSLPKYACQHNLNYWRFGDYLGIGAGAHGKITDKNIYRIEKTKDLKNFLTGKFIDKKYQIPQKDILLEFMMNALRLTEGIPLSLFHERTRIKSNPVANRYMEISHDMLKSTPLGRRYLNDYLQTLMD